MERVGEHPLTWPERVMGAVAFLVILVAMFGVDGG
jgi:hypothetical protein